MSKDYSRNEGRLTPDIGTVDQCNCGICNTEMVVERNYVGARTFAGAMAGSKSTYDFFQCPHLEEGWHKQAKAIKHVIRETPSKVLADLLGKEIQEIVHNKKQTKDFDLWAI